MDGGVKAMTSPPKGHGLLTFVLTARRKIGWTIYVAAEQFVAFCFQPRPIKVTTVATSAAKEPSFTISPHVAVGAFMAARFSQPVAF